MTIPFTTPGAFARAHTPIAGVLRRLAVAGALALTVFAVSASAASAGEHERIATKGGTVWFDHTGDYIGALDRRKDGYAVRAYLLWTYRHKPYTEEVTDNTGFTPGPNDPHRAVYRQLSIPEGTTARLIMCYVPNGRCSQPQFAEA
jgi:predicted amidohydrolase